MSETTTYLPNIKFEPNIPVTVKLKYSSGKECESKFGKSYLWGTDEIDGKQSFFATEALNHKIVELGAGEFDKITICKKTGDNKTWFEVEMANVPVVSGGGLQSAAPTPEPTVAPPSDRVWERLDGKFKAMHEACKTNGELAAKLWQVYMAETSVTDEDLPF